MKRRPALSLILCAALLAACGRRPAIPEAEPNDTAERAQLLTGECTVNGKLHSSEDVDLYRIELPEAHNVRVRLSGVPNADIVLSLLDGGGRELKRYDETGPDGQEEAVDLGLDLGVSYLRVAVQSTGRVAYDKPYGLVLDYEPMAGREREPNDSPAQATLVAGGAAGGRYYPSRNELAADKTEQDWLRLEVPQDRRVVLDAEVSGVPGVNPLLQVCDGAGRRLRAASGHGEGEGAALRGLGLSGPAAFVVLQAQDPVGNIRESYRLQASWRDWPGDVELEPNEALAAATPFEGESVSGTLAPVGDQDWYRFTVPAGPGAALSVRLTGVPDLDLTLSLRDAQGRELRRADAGGKSDGEKISGARLAAGGYFLAVSEKSGKVDDAYFTYTLTKSLTP